MPQKKRCFSTESESILWHHVLKSLYRTDSITTDNLVKSTMHKRPSDTECYPDLDDVNKSEKLLCENVWLDMARYIDDVKTSENCEETLYTY